LLLLLDNVFVITNSHTHTQPCRPGCKRISCNRIGSNAVICLLTWWT